jgi:F0F1-type ATP synthase delta subunit
MKYESLLDEIITTHEASEYINRLQHLANSLYHTDKTPLETMADVLTPQEHQRLISYAQKQSIDLENPENLHHLVQDLHDYITNIPIITLTVAFTPTQAFVKELTGWLSMHTTPPLRLEFEVNPDIIGGAIISYNGKTTDYSFRHQIEQITL